MKIFYELNKSPATHDIVYFLARACESGEDLQVRIVKGNRLLSPRDQLYSLERKEWRIHNLLIPVARLAKGVTGVTVVDEGEQTIPYVPPNTPCKPIFKAPEFALNIVNKAFSEIKNPVTINIRQSDFNPIRNSRRTEWMEVCKWLEKNGYTPVIIPDYEAELLGDSWDFPYITYRAAAHSHALRLAAWESSVANLGVTNGPMMMGFMSEAPMMVFKMVVPGITVCSEEYLKKIAMSPSDDWGEFKRIYWEADKADFIIDRLEHELPVFSKPKTLYIKDLYSLRKRV